MDEMARTLIFTEERQMELREYPIPEVPDNKVLVKVNACAICTWEQRIQIPRILQKQHDYYLRR